SKNFYNNVQVGQELVKIVNLTSSKCAGWGARLKKIIMYQSDLGENPFKRVLVST
ncbi:hypothetical protein SS7213T_13027, partial [Staphylococcus simiae CCM 7213 = CCUG 51256]